MRAKLARSRPDDTAVRHVAIDGPEQSCTWTELDTRSDQLAGALAERGLGTGDRLGLGLRNSIEFVLSVLAAWKLGATPVPIRWDLPDWEFTRLRDVVDAKVFLDADDREWIRSTATRAVPDLPDVFAPNDVGICSSGSTGTPKIIVSHRPGVYLDVLATPMMQNWRAVERPQTILVLAPMYHTNGFSTLYTLLGGDTLVIMEKFDAARVVDVIERHRVSTFTATPTMLQRIADLAGIDERDLSSIDWILQGAAPMPPSLVHRWISLIGAERIIMAYGMTESIGITVLRGDEWLEHEGSVGRGFRGTEIRILDDDQRAVPVGDIGEIYLRNPAYGGSEYLGEAPAMRGTDDGFATVGDLGLRRRRRIRLPRRPPSRRHHHRWRQRLPERSRSRAHRPPEDRRRGRHRTLRSGVGAASARDRRTVGARCTADRRRGDRVRQESARGLQGAEERRVRRRHPP